MSECETCGGVDMYETNYINNLGEKDLIWRCNKCGHCNNSDRILKTIPESK